MKVKSTELETAIRERKPGEDLVVKEPKRDFLGQLFDAIDVRDKNPTEFRMVLDALVPEPDDPYRIGRRN